MMKAWLQDYLLICLIVAPLSPVVWIMGRAFAMLALSPKRLACAWKVELAVLAICVAPLPIFLPDACGAIIATEEAAGVRIEEGFNCGALIPVLILATLSSLLTLGLILCFRPNDTRTP